jgi:nucleoporin NUP42
LTLETPTWIFSAYAPSKDTPEQLFGGETREKSFEEMRLLHLQAEASGNPQQAVSRILCPLVARLWLTSGLAG